MRFASVIFLSCLTLAAQVQVRVSNPNAPAVDQPPTRPEDLGAVEGSVFNAATGEPVKKAAVLMTRTDVAPNRNSPQQSYSTATDAAGRFTMKDIEPGKYRMTVTRNGFVTMAYGARGPTRPGTTLALDRAQKLKDVNFRLTPHGVIAGRILDEDGEPLPFVSVQLVQFQYRQGRQQMNMTAGSGTTNDLGDYRIFGVAPGKYYLRASARATGNLGLYATQIRSANGQPEEDFVPTYYPGTTNTANAAPIEVASGALVSGINFTLSKMATVHIKGSIANIPAAGRRQIQVMLLPRNQPFFGGLRPNFVDAKGNFDLPGVAPGQYMLSASMNDGGRTYSASIPVDVGNSNLENINLTISSGADIAGRIRIEGDTQQNLSNVNVTLQPRETGGIVFNGTPPARVKDDLSFQLQNVATEVFAMALFGLPDGFYVKSIKSGETDVLAAGLDVTRGAPQPVEVLVSPHAGLISGVVQNSSTGQPAPGATVVLVPQEKERLQQQQYYKTVTTDQNGSYTLKSLTPGEYKAFAWEDLEPGAYMDPDFMKPLESKSEPVTIRESDQKTLSLTMIPADAPR
jgi:protocatechuate 3,4-dioxygenase beta subunit